MTSSTLTLPRSAPVGRLSRFLPFLAWGRRLTPATLRDDLLAGLTGAVVVLPQGVAFAAIAGMPPLYGLYAGMVPAVIAALFGSSWHLVSGPTTAASIVLFSLLAPLAAPGSAEYVQLALTLTFLVGLTQLGLGLARLGQLVNFISHSVVIGFTSGAALLIAVNQAKYFFGLPVPQGSEFIAIVGYLFNHLRELNPYILGVSSATLLLGTAVRAWWPKVPYMVVAMLGGSLLAWGLNHWSLVPTGITTVGALNASWPPLSHPSLSLATLQTLAPGVIAVTLLALTEAVSIARALGLRSGQTIDGNQEFIAQGLSNLVGCFFSAYVATGSFNRSGVNYEAGAKTPLAAISAGLLLIGVATLIAPYAAHLPHAAMAGILCLVAWGLLDLPHIRHILHTSPAETLIMAVTFLATLLLTLETAILLGVMLSLGIYLARTSRPRLVPRVPDARHPHRKFTTPGKVTACPQLLFARLDGSLFFAATPHVQEQLDQLAPAGQAVHLALIATGINFIDLAGAELLAKLANRLRQDGGGLYLIHLKEAPRNLLERGGYLEAIDPAHLFLSKHQAIKEITSRLDPALCQGCGLKVFRECTTLNGLGNQEPVEMPPRAHAA